MQLNLGAGARRIEGWTSVDLAGEPDIVADVRTLPLPNDSVDQAMAIHVLEHLYRWDAPAALREWCRVLKPGGMLILELPDLIKCCRAVVDGASDRMGLWGLFGDPVYQDPLMTHRWCWRAEELRDELKRAGFRRVDTGMPVQWHKKARDMRLEARK